MEDSKEPTTEEVAAEASEEAVEEKPGEEDKMKAENAAKAPAAEEKKDEKTNEASAEAPAKEEDVEMKDAAAPTEDNKKKRKKAATPKSAAEGEGQEPEGENPSKRERRARKSVEAFNPEDFKHAEKTIQIVAGRGTELSQLKATRESIEKLANTEDLVTAHKMLFAGRGKVPRKDMIANVLAFSGYLPKADEGLDKKEQDAIDEEFEAKMGAKAYKMTVPLLKKLCDFFAVDRSNCNGKDALVDILLDFLGEPSEDKLKGAAKPKGKPIKKKGKAKKEEDDEEDGDDDDVGEEDDVGDDKVEAEDSMPSDETLRSWVRAYVQCHNMKKSTIKHALEIAGDKFGVDLSEKKARLKELLTEEM